MGPVMHRRDAIRTGLGTAAMLAIGPDPRPSGVVSFRLIEPSGFRRVAEPISAVVPIAGPGLRFRLIRDGRAIPAQVRPILANGSCTAHRLDFAADLGPDEKARYELQYGAMTEPGPGPSVRWDLENTPDDFRIARDRVVTFAIDRALRPVNSLPASPAPVGFGRLAPEPWIAMRGAGTVWLNERNRAVTSTITREGPFAIGLRFAWDGPSGIASTLDLDFPATRDLVDVRWAVDDPDDRAEALWLQLGLGMDAARTVAEVEPGPDPRWASVAGPHRRALAVIAGRDDADRPTIIGATPEGTIAISRRFPAASPVKLLAFRVVFSRPDRATGREASLDSLLLPIRQEWDLPAPSRA